MIVINCNIYYKETKYMYDRENKIIVNMIYRINIISN